MLAQGPACAWLCQRSLKEGSSSQVASDRLMMVSSPLPHLHPLATATQGRPGRRPAKETSSAWSAGSASTSPATCGHTCGLTQVRLAPSLRLPVPLILPSLSPWGVGVLCRGSYPPPTSLTCGHLGPCGGGGESDASLSVTVRQTLLKQIFLCIKCHLVSFEISLFANVSF